MYKIDRRGGAGFKNRILENYQKMPTEFLLYVDLTTLLGVGGTADYKKDIIIFVNIYLHSGFEGQRRI